MSSRPWILPTLVLSVAALGGALAPLRGAAGPSVPANFQLTGSVERGRAIYQRSCALCHGAKGDGQGAAAKSASVRPADFTNSRAMAKVPDREIYLAIRDGGVSVGRSAQMLAYRGILQEQQILDVATFVRSLAKASR
jgi:cytochrome c oxidase cbb3-type subunit 3